MRGSDGGFLTGVFGAVAVGIVRVGVGVAAVGGAVVGAAAVSGAVVGAAVAGITLVVAGGVIEVVEAVGVDGVDGVAVEAGGADGVGAEGAEVGGTEGVESSGFDTGGVETEDGVAAADALGAAGEGRILEDGLGGSLFATYSCAARVATRRKRTRRKMRPMTTARASSEKKPHTTSPASPRKPAPMSYIPGKIGLGTVTPLARRQLATAPRPSPRQRRR